MLMLILAFAGAMFLLAEAKNWQPRRHSKQIPIQDRKVDPWSKIVQKKQVIVSEPFTSIGGYAIACDGRDFMYAPEVDQVQSGFQVENPQELPVGV